MGSELKTKKAAFQKKCAKQKESITKNALAEQAYQESKTKKMCMKTRVASELNNKRMVEYYDFGIKKLKLTAIRPTPCTLLTATSLWMVCARLSAMISRVLCPRG